MLFSFLFRILMLFYFCLSAKGERSGQDTEHLDFKLMVEPKDVQPYTVILVASSRLEKSAWTSDISQVCLAVYVKTFDFTFFVAAALKNTSQTLLIYRFCQSSCNEVAVK